MKKMMMTNRNIFTGVLLLYHCLTLSCGCGHQHGTEEQQCCTAPVSGSPVTAGRAG